MKFNFSSVKKKLIRLVVSLVALLILLCAADLIGTNFSIQQLLQKLTVSFGNLLSLAIMILAVLTGKNLLALILDVCVFDNNRAKTIVTIIRSLLQYIAWLVIICWGLSIIGVPISTIVASVGVLALIVGFGAESLIADVVTGLFMLIENQYNVGDIIEIDGYRGMVTSIGIRTTSVEDPSGNIKVINNSSMVNILNRSDISSVAVSDFPLPIGTDLVKLESYIDEILDGIYKNHSNIMLEKPVYKGIQSMTTSEIVLRFVVKVNDKYIYTAGRAMNHDLLLAFRSKGF